MEKYTIQHGNKKLSVSIQLEAGTAVVWYNRDTIIGRRLLGNVGFICEIQANYIRQLFGLVRNIDAPAKVEFCSLSA